MPFAARSAYRLPMRYAAMQGFGPPPLEPLEAQDSGDRQPAEQELWRFPVQTSMFAPGSLPFYGDSLPPDWQVRVQRLAQLLARLPDTPYQAMESAHGALSAILAGEEFAARVARALQELSPYISAATADREAHPTFRLP